MQNPQHLILTSTIERLKAKDPLAQKAIFEQYGSFLYRIAYRYVRDRMLAEDLMVDAMLKIFDGVAQTRFENLKSFEAWMRRIVVNEALMVLRRNANFHMMPESEAHEQPVDDHTIENISADEIFHLIAELPDGYRTVFSLYGIEGYTHKEIGELLGISEGTSKSQLNHARKLLQKKILSIDKSQEFRLKKHNE